MCALSAIPQLSEKAVAADDSTETPQSHRQFVDSCLTELATQLLSRFTPNRSHPIVIVADSSQDSAGTFAAQIGKILSDRGLLIRDASPEDADAGNWSLFYSLGPLDLALTEPQRRTFLGRIWLKRTLHARLQISVRDDVEGSVWNDSIDSTFSDWVAKRDLKSLSGDGFSAVAPVTGWERAKTPLIIGGTAVVIGVFILALR